MAVIRGQDTGTTNRLALETPGSSQHLKRAMPVSQATAQTGVTQVQYTAPPAKPGGQPAWNVQAAPQNGPPQPLAAPQP